jgi:alpha-L-arabinofuranosidase
LSYIGDETWTDYTLSLKARKLKGEEGFLIVFGRQGEEKIWWNLGGWGNQEHALEFNRNPMGRHVPGKIETGRWYDIKIELAGPRVRCFLDGKLIHDEAVPETSRLFASAGWNDTTREWILKVINTSNESMTARLNWNGLATPGAEAQCTVLSSAKPTDNNSMEQPTRIVPVSRKIRLADTHEFPANSLTILRLGSPQ